MKKDFMKFIILLLITFPVFACQIQVPTSEAQRIIEAMPNGVPPLWSCADKPDDTCHCADNTVWEYAEIKDDVLQDSPEKKAAHEAKLEADKLAEDTKQAKRKAAKDTLKGVDIDGATTIAKLKVIVKALLEAQE